MIEVSDRKYWKKMKYHDALLYVSLLEIDGKNNWRLLNRSWEGIWANHNMYKKYNHAIWHTGEYEKYHDTNFELMVIPVRDTLFNIKSIYEGIKTCLWFIGQIISEISWKRD